MKMKFILLLALLFTHYLGFSQYIGVRARYAETRLVDDSPNPPKRENRLILSFYAVNDLGVYAPTVLSNYDIWVYKQGFQYGNIMGGMLDSSGNNYDGYAWPAPKAVAYYNSLGLNYIDCDPNAATHYVVNGHELDCGFITVSYWDMDYGTGQAIECFPAPNVCLPYFFYPDSYATLPGNVNFTWPIPPTAPYNWYSFSCAGGTQQLLIRGVLPADSSEGPPVVLPVLFANVLAAIDGNNQVTLSWSNMTESDISEYVIECSGDGRLFVSTGTVLPTANDGGRADYVFYTRQSVPVMYYRIKAVESTGTKVYSSVLLVKQDEPASIDNESFKIYPNPVSGVELSIRLKNAESGRYICTVVTSDGQPVRNKLIDHINGDLIRQIDMNGLAPGIYQIVLRNSNKKFTQQFLYVN